MNKAFAFSLLLLLSCNKKEVTPYDDARDSNMGETTAMINGEKWLANVSYATYDAEKGKISLSLSLYSNGIIRQHISVDNVKMTENITQDFSPLKDSLGYSINQNYRDSCSAIFFLQDHDVLESTYHIVPNSSSNNITLTHLNTKEKRASGTFNMHLYTTDNPAQGFDDTLRITEGKFDITYK